MHHDRKARRHYESFSETTECQFCNPQKYASKLIAEYEHSYIMANRTFYTHWELRKVVDHLMIVPRRHVLNLSELEPVESEEIMKLMGDYEQQGYDIFARSPQSTRRSMPHQHTHLIKATGRASHGMFFWRKPYILKLFR